MTTVKRYTLVVLALLLVCGAVGYSVFGRKARTPRSLPDLIEGVREAVVHIKTPWGGEGSGCLISADGVMFTAKHMTDGKWGDYRITLDDRQTFGIKYILEDKENDITFMQLDLAGHDPNLPYARLSNNDGLRVGDSVFMVGSPLGSRNFNAASTGILAALNRDFSDSVVGARYDWHVMLHSTSPAYPGNSGCPVFGMDGKVIGVLVGGADATLNYSVPVARFRDTLSAVRNHFRLCRFNVIEEDEPEPAYDVYYEMEGLRGALSILSREDK